MTGGGGGHLFYLHNKINSKCPVAACGTVSGSPGDRNGLRVIFASTFFHTVEKNRKVSAFPAGVAHNGSYAGQQKPNKKRQKIVDRQSGSG